MKKLILFSCLLTLVYACSSSKTEEQETNTTDSETTSSEADLENGREEIMEQRSMQESLPPEENSDESYTYDNQQTQEPIINWYCAWCCKIIQSSDEPNGGRCRGSYKNNSYAGKTQRESNTAVHTWYELSKVGNQKFQCSHCDVIVDSEQEPKGGMCDGGDRLESHYWQEL